MGATAGGKRKAAKRTKKSGKSTARQRYAKDLKFLAKTTSASKRIQYLNKCKHKKGLLGACQRACKTVLRRPEAFYKSKAAFSRDKPRLLGAGRSVGATNKLLAVSGRGIISNILSTLLNILP